MKKSEWSDREIEELLRQMPKVKDHRNPIDMNQNFPFKKRNAFPWLVPSIATAAAVFLCIILGTKFIGGPTSQLFQEKSLNEKSLNQQITLKKENIQPKDQTFSGSDNREPLKSSIYENEVRKGKVITYWIPDEQAQNIIPISTIVHNIKNKSRLDVFNEKMAQLNENEWGLDDFYPINADFNFNEKSGTVDVNVPADHEYGKGSSNELMFINIIKKDISSNSNVKKARLFTDGKPGIEFGNTGIKNEIMIQPERHHAYLFYYPNRHESPYLVPSIEPFENIRDAFKAMKKDRNGLKKSMHLKIKENELSIRNKVLYLPVERDSKIKNDQLTVFSYEALLLTAKEFGMEKVVITDAPIKQIGPFDLTKENKVPIAPNMRNIE